MYVKGTKADRISETAFFKHKYLINTTSTYADKLMDSSRALCDALSKKKQGMHNSTMEYLKKLSDIFLTTAKISNNNMCEEPTKNAH